MRAWQRTVIVILVAADAAACTLVLGVSDIPDPVDAGTGGSTSSASSASGSSSASGAPDGAQPCPVLYVSAQSGDDGNDGCTHATAFKTITAAVSRVENLGQPGYTIQVFRGTYAEDHLVIHLAGTILGGYDCVGWARKGDYGYPVFNPINESIITNGAASEANHNTLQVKAPAVDGGAPLVLDGFSIHGASNLADTAAVILGSGSQATISNCYVTGGDATATTYGVNAGGASLVLEMNRITAGVASGQSPPGVSMGVFLSSATARIDTNFIDASGTGSTSSPGGAFGIRLSASSPVDMTVASGSPIINNHITSGAGLPSVGIYLAGSLATVDVVGNFVQTTRGLASVDGGASNVALVAVRANGSGPVHLLGNRLYGGGNALTDFGRFQGVHLTGVPKAVVANNLVYGGYHDPGDADPGGAVGVQLEGCDAPLLEDNTIFTGYAGGTDTANAVLLTNGTTSAALRNNILAGSGDNDRGLGVDGCASSLQALEHNLFVGFGGFTLYQFFCGDAGSASVKDIAGISPLFPAATIGGNLIMTSACSAADNAAGNCLVNSACPVGATTSKACLGTLFNGWSALSGYQDFTTTGWPLAPNSSCRIAHGGKDLSSAPFPITTDFHDAGRSLTPTIGAIEVGDAGCD